MIKGSQAPATRPALYLWAAMFARGSSSAKRHIFLGFQKRRNTTVHSSENRPEVISTRLLSILLDQNHCMAAKDTPTTMIAGKTSKVCLQLTMARTSQKGTMTAVMGRMHPTMAVISASGTE